MKADCAAMNENEIIDLTDEENSCQLINANIKTTLKLPSLKTIECIQCFDENLHNKIKYRKFCTECTENNKLYNLSWDIMNSNLLKVNQIIDSSRLLQILQLESIKEKDQEILSVSSVNSQNKNEEYAVNSINLVSEKDKAKQEVQIKKYDIIEFLSEKEESKDEIKSSKDLSQDSETDEQQNSLDESSVGSDSELNIAEKKSPLNKVNTRRSKNCINKGGRKCKEKFRRWGRKEDKIVFEILHQLLESNSTRIEDLFDFESSSMFDDETFEIKSDFHKEIISQICNK